MEMRTALAWLFGAFSFGIFLQPALGAEPDIFLLGLRDGRSAEFGLAHENLIWQSNTESLESTALAELEEIVFAVRQPGKKTGRPTARAGGSAGITSKRAN